MDAMRSLQTVNMSSAIDALKNLNGTATMPPVYDEYLAKGWLSQEEYDNLKAVYQRANQSVADNLKTAEDAQAWYDKFFGNKSTGSNSSSTSVGDKGSAVAPGSGSSAAIAGSSSGMNTAATIGIILGALALVTLVVGVVLYYKRRPRGHRRRRRTSKGGSIDDATAGSTEYSRMYHTSTLRDDAKLNELAPWKDETLVAVRVPLDNIHLSNLVSRGGFGEVYKGTFRSQVVAIKTLLPEKRKDVNHIKSFLAEIKFMSTLDHPRVVSFVGVAWESLCDLCVVTEFMDGGDLRSLLESFDKCEPPRPRGFDGDKIKIALHVAHALTYLHSLQPAVVHRDLKSRNILLDAEWNAKLTDFGVSRERIDHTMTAGVGSSLWMAPEVMLGERYDEKADVFSFGVVLAELDTQQLPYADATEPGTGRSIPQTATLQLVSLGRLTVALTEPTNYPDLRQLALDCVSVEPSRRPTTAEALHRLHVAWKHSVEQGGLI